MDSFVARRFQDLRSNVIPRRKLADQIVDRLEDYLVALQNPKNRASPLIDEQIWTFLFVYGFREEPNKLFECLTEHKEPAPENCKSWLEMMPMPVRQGSHEEGSEGNTYIDLISGSIANRTGTKAGVQYRPPGPVCLVEAKWKSDIAGYTTHDPQRNQLARVIETAVTLQHHTKGENLDKPTDEANAKEKLPEKVYVTLLTPKVFKVDSLPANRFYAYKYFEYRNQWQSLRHDIFCQHVPQRPSSDWTYPSDISDRLNNINLCWVTYENLFLEMPPGDYKEALRCFVNDQFIKPTNKPISPLLDQKFFK
ncbi:MAG: hypothetical protein KOO60_07770 [Gemmatimonadales bacterium]|nr:hypothetical protein [Gemmatimonadales bacterium]